MKPARGIEPDLCKDQTLSEPRIRSSQIPDRIIIPIPNACQTVSVKDTVLRGQRIAEGVMPIHASTSGLVTAVEIRPHPILGLCSAIEIETDGEDKAVDGFGLERNEAELESLGREDILMLLKNAGLWDLSQNGEPVFSKLEAISNGKSRTLILNGTESEPYLTADHLLMLSKPVEILRGIEWMIRASGAEEALIVISENKMECLEVFKSKIFRAERGPLTLKIPRIKFMAVKNHHPQDFPSQFNVSTAFSVYEAVKYRKPLTERVITVAGSCMMQPQNVWVRIGSPVNEIVEQCGGFLRFPRRLVMGGAMTGIAQSTLEVPLLAGTRGVLALPADENLLSETSPCIRCGDCIPVCPVSLNPVMLVDSAMRQDWIEVRRYDPQNCVECGNCSYVCPSKIPMLEWIQEAKRKCNL